jgi:hypothetical protein
MTYWSTFWTWFLIFALAIFLGLAVVVSVGGLFDIRALFRSIRSQHGEESR